MPSAATRVWVSNRVFSGHSCLGSNRVFSVHSCLGSNLVFSAHSCLGSNRVFTAHSCLGINRVVFAQSCRHHSIVCRHSWKSTSSRPRRDSLPFDRLQSAQDSAGVHSIAAWHSRQTICAVGTRLLVSQSMTANSLGLFESPVSTSETRVYQLV